MGSRVPPAVTRTVRPVRSWWAVLVDAACAASAGDDFWWFRQASWAGVFSGETACGWVKYGHAAFFEGLNVVLRCGVLPHFCVHGWCEHNWCGGDKGRGSEEVIGSAGRKTRDEVCGCWCDDNKVCVLPNVDVVNIGHMVEHAGGGGLSAEGFPGRLPNKV